MTVETNNPIYKGCYLTIDDGPDESFSEKVAWLDEQGIKALWYCQGNHLLQYEEAVIKAIRGGHIISNHSYDHPNFETLSDEEAIAQVEQTQSMIDGLYLKAGVTYPLKTFRYPYLVSGSQTFSRYLYENGFRHPNFEGVIPKIHDNDNYLSASSVGTNFDTGDWRIVNENENYDEAMCIRDLKNNISQWVQEQKVKNSSKRTYTIILSHCFTKTSLFKEMVSIMIQSGMVFELPTSGLATHLLPIERQDEHHECKHSFIMTHKERDNVELVLVGDSITRRWEDNPSIQDKYMGAYSTINMGVGGDTINNLLWRIHAGELDNLKPTYISLLIGTNSLPYYPDPQIIEGIKTIVSLVRAKCPSSTLIYNHLFPRNPDKDCEDYIGRITAINQVMKEWLPADVIQLSMTDAFLGELIQVPEDIMSDGLHIGEKGYHLWGKALKKILA